MSLRLALAPVSSGPLISASSSTRPNYPLPCLQVHLSYSYYSLGRFVVGRALGVFSLSQEVCECAQAFGNIRAFGSFVTAAADCLLLEVLLPRRLHANTSTATVSSSCWSCTARSRCSTRWNPGTRGHALSTRQPDPNDSGGPLKRQPRERYMRCHPAEVVHPGYVRSPVRRCDLVDATYLGRRGASRQQLRGRPDKLTVLRLLC